VARDLKDSQAKDVSDDWRFAIAYNAALHAATAALAAAGYRASRENHHYRVIQSLELTLGKDAKFIRAFDAFRKKRNVKQLRHWRRNLPSRSRRDDRDCGEFAAGRRAMDTNKSQFTSIAKRQFPLSSGLNSLSLDRHREVTVQS